MKKLSSLQKQAVLKAMGNLFAKGMASSIGRKLAVGAGGGAILGATQGALSGPRTDAEGRRVGLLRRAAGGATMGAISGGLTAGGAHVVGKRAPLQMTPPPLPQEGLTHVAHVLPGFLDELTQIESG